MVGFCVSEINGGKLDYSLENTLANGYIMVRITTAFLSGLKQQHDLMGIKSIIFKRMIDS
jgi:hypothetical protein